jgi:hypothetical protein
MTFVRFLEDLLVTPRSKNLDTSILRFVEGEGERRQRGGRGEGGKGEGREKGGRREGGKGGKMTFVRFWKICWYPKIWTLRF